MLKLIKNPITYICILALLLSLSGNAQQSVYTLDATVTGEPVRRGHFKLGEHPGTPHQFGANNLYFERDGKPWYPVMGEFHYSRYPHEYWEEEILKMKSAGISVMATYVFWNTHEYPRDIWNWKGDFDLTRFVELCQKHDLYVWLRIGPWCHGEQLYGGHPEWIAKMPGKRSNAPDYIKEVAKLFGQVAQQTQGLYYKQGGPVIGVQLENEYASGQAEHMDTLKQMALQAGISPVYFTITANTVFNDREFGFLPLQGAYPYRGWTKGGGGPTKDFLYGNDQWILGDALGKLYYDPSLYPRGLCEQGCGGQMMYRNRFTIEPHVVEAHLQNQIGRGMNLIGYYMFHGGTQTPGFKEPGYPESYDFQAPIGEFGLLKPSYRYLRILHHFINDFGEDLAAMPVVYPESPVTNEYNTDSLRYVARAMGNSGFLFLGNTQVRIPMPDKMAKFQIRLPGETLEFPRKSLIVKGETTAILPFNLPLKNGVSLKYATAQPLARIVDSGKEVIFLMELQGTSIELALESKKIKKITAKGWHQETKHGIVYLTKGGGLEQPIVVQARSGEESTLVLVNRQEAENSWRGKINGKESIIFTPADIFVYKETIVLRQMDNPNFDMTVYPKPTKDFVVLGKKMKAIGRGIFNRYTATLDASLSEYDLSGVSTNRAILRIPKELPEHCSDVLVDIDYLGGSATASIDGSIVTDHLFHGPVWQMGIKRYLEQHGGGELVLEALPWSDDISGVAPELIKTIKDQGPLIKDLKISPQYQILISIK